MSWESSTYHSPSLRTPVALKLLDALKWIWFYALKLTPEKFKMKFNRKWVGSFCLFGVAVIRIVHFVVLNHKNWLSVSFLKFTKNHHIYSTWNKKVQYKCVSFSIFRFFSFIELRIIHLPLSITQNACRAQIVGCTEMGLILCFKINTWKVQNEI